MPSAATMIPDPSYPVFPYGINPCLEIFLGACRFIVDWEKEEEVLVVITEYHLTKLDVENRVSLIQSVLKLPFDKLPLFINDDNQVVREMAILRLSNVSISIFTPLRFRIERDFNQDKEGH